MRRYWNSQVFAKKSKESFDTRIVEKVKGFSTGPKEISYKKRGFRSRWKVGKRRRRNDQGAWSLKAGMSSSRKCETSYTLFFYKEPVIRNLHVEGRNI